MASRSLDSLQQEAYRIFPGAALALIIAAASYRLIAEHLPVSALLVALIAGIGLRALGWVPWWGERGLTWSAGFPLRLGVVMLGLQLSVSDVLGLGPGVLAVVVATVLITWAGMRLLGPVFRVDPTTTALVSIGTAVCGASAVAAASSVLDRGDGRDRLGKPLQGATATALAVVTIYGTLLMVAMPPLVGFLRSFGTWQLSDQQAGIWIGASIHEVGQVVAAGGMISAVALATATVVKLARVLLLAPIVLTLRLTGARARPSTGQEQVPTVVGLANSDAQTGAGSQNKRGFFTLLPWFVMGFVLAVAVNSLTDIPEETANILSQSTTMLITVAMVGIGTCVDLRDLRRTGAPAMALGAVGTLIAVGVAGASVFILG